MKIKVLSQKHIVTRENGKQDVFYSYFSPCKIHVIDKDGNDIGEQLKNIDVHFTKVATKKLPDDKVFAIIGSTKPENIQLPYVYKVSKNEETGEISYPTIWIRDFDSYEEIPYTSKKSTCKPVIDEPSSVQTEEQESEPVEIVEEN